MLKGSSLIYGILVSLLVVLVSGSLLLLDALKRSFVHERVGEEAAVRDVRSGFELLLASEELLPPDTRKEHSLYGNGEGKVSIERRPWGLLELLRSSTAHQGDTIALAGLVGRGLKEENEFALYLADRSDVLTLSGSTNLRGKCAVPAGRVERGYIEGKNFEGSELVHGKTVESERELPPIQEGLIPPLEERLDGKFRESDSVVPPDVLEQEGGVEHSFSSKPLVIDHRGASLDLSGLSVKGNVVILSGGEVRIGRRSELEDLIVFADRIHVEEGFRGDLQGFARTRIDVGEEAVLDYPSALGVIGGTKGDTSVMELAEGAQLTGFLLYLPRNKGMAMGRGRVDLMEESIVEGQVYVDGLAQPRGRIEGSLYCKGLYLATPSSVYRDHLLDATIDLGARSEHFVGSGLVHPSRKKEVIEWL